MYSYLYSTFTERVGNSHAMINIAFWHNNVDKIFVCWQRGVGKNLIIAEVIIFSSTSFCLFKDPPTLKPSNKTTVREGTSDVRLFCDVVTDGNPAKYSNLIWQHWIGNTFIRKLDPDNLPNGSPIKTLSLTMQSVRIN